ncbi:MAG: nucleotidyl transferase AbiEii/AbiGii toxin family protein [Phycisphaerae bacterium]
MTRPEPPAIAAHRDPDLFRQAVAYTARTTGFAARLIEKDYFCTVLLAYLARTDAGLIFKGGTALAKVHAGFYRLSEDLDFTIPMPIDASRRQRSHAASPLKDAMGKLEASLPEFTLHEPLRGSNNSAQYNALVRYDSLATGQVETLRVEVGLREPLLIPPTDAPARTMLRNPITDKPLAPDLTLPCIDLKEALAEKLRAALTRREVAIRDFYDLHHAAQHLGLTANAPELLDLLRRKLAIPGNPPIDLAPNRIDQLRRQRDARLRPVLRPKDFDAFDLDHTVRIAERIAEKLR